MGTRFLEPVRGFLYPFFFALYIPLFYYSRYFGDATPWTFLLTLFLALGAAVSLSLIFIFLTRDRAKRSFLVLLYLIPLLSYGQYFSIISTTRYWPLVSHYHPVRYGTVLVVIIATYLTLRAKQFPENLGKVLTLITALLLIFSSVNALYAARANIQLQALLTPTSLSPTSRPDIYFLVFDEYTGPKALGDLYHFDDSGFVQGLKNRGFYFAGASSSNYFGSITSLASEMNYQYFDDAVRKIAAPQNDSPVMGAMAENNRVVTSLKQAGYQYYHLGSWYPQTRGNKNADQNLYALNLLQSLPFYFQNYLGDFSAFSPFRRAFYTPNVQQIVDFQLKQTVELAKKADVPKFVFSHILIPHEPYLYDANCKGRPATSKSDLGHYLDQTTCTNQLILSLLDQIRANSPKPPVIILQSDEGNDVKYAEPTATSFTPQAVEEKFSTLSAIYFPDQDYATLYPSMSSINTFPLVFNKVFGSQLPIQPDKNYILGKTAAGTAEVTDEVKQVLGTTSP